MKISAVVICGNEERNITDCLESLKWCDEIVVVDSFSTDKTVELARRFTDKVIQRAWPGYNAQRTYAMEQATGDWILALDADERCTPQLRDAIKKSVESANGVAGFEVRRHTFYLGRWINHGGWYPDWKCRLVRRGLAKCEGIEPHDLIVPAGKVGRIDGDIEHFTYRSFSEQLKAIDKFSDTFAERWTNEGRRFSLFKALVHPPLKFFGCYVWKLGFLDGWPGFVIAAASSFYVFAKYVKLRERK